MWRRNARFVVASVLLVVTAGLAGCAGDSIGKTNVTFIQRDAGSAPATEMMPVVGVDDELEVTYLKEYPADRAYRFDVGDVLELQFYTRTEPAQSYTVQPDGRIYLPEFGYLTVRGLTADEIAAQVRKGYERTRLAGPVNVVARTTDAKVNEMIATLARAPNGPTRSVRVMPDGTITLPLIDSLKVGGQTLAEVQSDINAIYGRQFNNLHVSVDLHDTSARRYGVVGEVNTPGIFPFVSQTTLLDALIKAGGIKDTAKAYDVVVFRPRDKGVEVTEIDTGGSNPQAVSRLTTWKIEPSDTIYVPKSGIANFDQFIREYIRDAAPFPTNLYYGGSAVLQ